MRLRTCALLAPLLLATVGPAQAQSLRLSIGDIDPQQLSRGADDAAADASASHLLVQFEAGRAGAVRAALLALGARVEAYVPDRAFRVRRDGVSLSALRAIAGVRWVGRWRNEWKMHAATRAAPGTDEFVLYGHVDGDGDALVAEVRKRLPQARVLQQSRGARLARVVIRLAQPSLLDRLVASDAVTWIAPHVRPETHNTEASGAIQGGAVGVHPLWARGLTGHGQIVALADSGLDANEAWFTRYDPGSGVLLFVTPAQPTVPPAVGSTVANAKVVANWVQPGAEPYETLDPCGSVAAVQHGTHVAGTIAGDSGTTATPTSANADAGDGMAPNAQILFQDIGADCLVVDDYAATLRQAHAGGARIHNNSWGAATGNAYTGYDFDADDTSWALEDLLIVASAGNRDEAIAAIGSPGNAKNVLTVGALLHGANTCPATLYTTQGQWGSSIGPGSGWRDKPEISAPGTATMSAAGDDFSLGGEEPAVAKALSGTSMAAPTVAGGAALMRQYFVEGWYPRGSARSGDRLNPLAATLKAAVVNSTGELINSFIGEARLPSYITGWGRMYLDRDLYFPGDGRRQRVFERSHGSGLATGEVHEYAIEQVAAGQSLRATLAWFDAASIPGVEYPLVNDLDLELIGPNGEVYRGNAFGDDVSCQTQACYDPCAAPLPQRPFNRTVSLADFGTRDARNTVEAVRILAPVSGRYVLRVIGFDVPGNDRIGSDRQGYGLVVAGDFGAPSPTPVPAPQNLSVAQNDLSGIRIAFDGVADADSYQLYRANGACAAADLAEFHLAGVAATAAIEDPNTVGGDRYAYRVRAVDADAEGEASDCIEVVSQDSCELPPLFDRQAPQASAAFAQCRVQLDWNPAPPRCAHAAGVDYLVQRADSPDFANPQSFAATAPPFDDLAVMALTPYYYRIIAVDALGNASAPGAVRNVTTTGAGGPAGLGFLDDIDTRTHAIAEAPWRIAAGMASQGQYAYRSGAVDTAYLKNTCASLELPALTIPDAATLEYDARFHLESGWDGVVVELSADDGATWQDLPPSGGYPGSFADTQSPPINACGYPSSQGAFNGSNGGFQAYASDLSAFAGQRVRIRWRLSTDPAVEFDGFNLDRIRILAPGDATPADLILRASFDNNDAAAIGAQCVSVP
jgi:subtilisin family serine protease